MQELELTEMKPVLELLDQMLEMSKVRSGKRPSSAPVKKPSMKPAEAFREAAMLPGMNVSMEKTPEWLMKDKRKAS